MGKNADTSGRVDDPDLAPDAQLAADLGDEEERRKQQLAYYGGEDDDIDDFDASGLDDGSDLDFKPAEDDSEEDSEEDDEDSEEEDDAESDETTDAEETDEEEDSEADEAGDGGEESDGDEGASGKAEKPQGIPKHRFDEVNERRKAAEKRLAELEAQQKAEQQADEDEYDFDAAEMEYQDLLLDGKTDEALAKRKEIRAAEHAAWKNETKQETQSDLSAKEAADEVNNLSIQAEAMFPVFDQDHEDYNHAMTNKVLTYYRGYVAGGEYDNLGDAFVAALADVVEQYGLTDRYGINLDGTPKESPKPKPTGKKKVADKEKVREQAHQPAASGGEGSSKRGVAAPSIMDMTDADMDKLSEEQLARLRGDFI